MRSSCIVGVGVFLLSFVFAVSGECPAQMSGKYRTQGSAGTQWQAGGAMQEFKAQQQQKMQQYLAQYEKENKEFMATIAGMPKEAMLASLKEHILKQYDKTTAFRDQAFKEWRVFIGNQLNANPNMQQAMKDQMLARMDQDYQEQKAFFAGKLEEDKAFLDELKRDVSIAGQALSAKLQEFFQSQNDDAKEFLKSQQQKYQTAK